MMLQRLEAATISVFESLEMNESSNYVSKLQVITGKWAAAFQSCVAVYINCIYNSFIVRGYVVIKYFSVYVNNNNRGYR